MLNVTPTRLNLTKDGVQTLTFTLPAPAPAGGQLLDITTDIPDSIIMAEVIVPAGESTVTAEVKGGAPGTGHLFLKGYGSSGEINIPVTVE